MRGLSLHQPWASLVICGAKRLETRGWRPPTDLVGHRFAVHAALNTASLGRCRERPFNRHVPDPAALPLGAILGVVTLRWFSIMTEATVDLIRAVDPVEYAFGDFAAGRWAWCVTDPVRFAEPIPFVGRQRFFQVPDQIDCHGRTE